MSSKMRLYDVVIFDSVGMPYTGSTPEHGGLGGSELEAILLAEALARRGRSVLVLNQTLLPANERGVAYAHHQVAHSTRIGCRTLIVARYSYVPPVEFQNLVVAVSDAAGARHQHLAPYFQDGRRATLVAVSAWQRSLFPPEWNAAVIPNMLPERVYSYAATHPEVRPDPRRFIFASAALKGLPETLDAWQKLKSDARLADAELAVCTPGYDAVDEAALGRAGVAFLGNLPFERVVGEIARSAGLFYVNTFPETFCIVAALAEALGRRLHVLCTKDVGALRETTSSPLITTRRDEFEASFLAAYAAPDDPRWYGVAKDYRESTVMEAWLRVLSVDRNEKDVPSVDRPPATLCLNMIVKDEAHVIERCLESAKALVSYWVIVDTGSTDGTQEIIRRVMAGIPGELHERPWKDFASNRTEAIELARGKADYLLVLDADDVIEVSPGFRLGALGLDCYELRVEDHGMTYCRHHVFRSDFGYRYVGVLHEVLTAPRLHRTGRIEGLVYRRLGGGARSTDPSRYRKDAEVLEKALLAEPDNARYAFYLAQTYRDAGDLEQAATAYERRVQMGGWAEEVWASLVTIAQIYVRLGKSDDSVILAFLRAHEFRPQRAEALCQLAAFCRSKNRPVLAHVFASAIVGVPRPDDILWLDESVYAWRALDEYAIASYYVGRHEDAISANRRLLASPDLPESERARVQKNMDFSTAVVRAKEQGQSGAG